MFTIEMLPGRHGDALWIEYGAPGSVHRVLIDGGSAGTHNDIRARLDALPADDRHFELLVVTHVDADHIAGVLRLLEDDALAFTVGDVWFNGWGHLPGNIQTFGPVQGERLSARIVHHDLRWNHAFLNRAVAVPESGELPCKPLPGGLQLTVLSPGTTQLERLKTYWQREVQAAGLDPGLVLPPPPPVPAGVQVFGGAGVPDVAALAATPFDEDESPANGSSIALLAEFEGKRALLSGDAYPSVLIDSFDRLAGAGATVDLDVFKLPHHGSQANVSVDVVSRVRCPRFLVSTNGSYFDHPDQEAVARVITAGGDNPTICFNYSSPETLVWANAALQQIHGYEARYPAAETAGLGVTL